MVRLRPPRLPALGCAALVVAATLTTLDAAADEAAAQLLFEEGKALRDQGRWPQACAKFQASMKLDPSLGPLLNIAICHERDGRLASALAAYERARVMNRVTPEPERRQKVSDHITKSVEALRPRVPMLAVGVSQRPPGLVVTRGDAVLPLEALDHALPVDPGELVLRARAQGFAGESSATLREGETKRVIVELRPVADANQPSTAPRSADAAQGDEPAAWPWLVGGAGLALGGAAVGFGIWYHRTVDEMTERCGGELVPCRPNPPGSYDPADDNATKNSAAALTVVFAIAGGAALGAGIIGLVVTAAESEEPSAAVVRVGPGPGDVGAAATVSF